MAIRIPSNQLINPQSLEAAVSGPDGANRLFVFTGAAPVGLISNGQPQKETFTWLLGPQLSRRQFIGAVADASISQWQIADQGGLSSSAQFTVDLAEADWDDESQQVECRVEVTAAASSGKTAFVGRLNFHVTVLAEIAP